MCGRSRTQRRALTMTEAARHWRSVRGPHWPSSGREPLEQPSPRGIPAVAQPVVQAIVAVLPELDRVRRHPVAAPERWKWDVAVAEARRDPLDLGLELGAARHRLALTRRPRAELARARPVSPVRNRLRRVEAAHGAGHPHLAPEIGPVEHQRGPWVRSQVTALVALGVRVEAQAALVEPPEQHHPRRRLTLGCRGGHHHVVCVVAGNAPGLVVPARQLDEWISVDVVFGERHDSVRYAA